MSQTWNNGAVTFTGLKFNAAGTSDANSAAASLLMDLQVNTASKFRVSKTGNVYAAGLFGTSTGVANGFNLNVFSGSQIVVYTDSGTTANAFDKKGFKTASDAAFGFTDTPDPSGGIDTILTRRGPANLRLGAADVGATTATVTITIATPGVVTWTRHTFSNGTPVVFTTTGALPTGITSGTTYYAVVVDTNTFQIASSVANAIAATPTVITTSGSQSGTHTGTRYNITQRLSMQSVTGVTDRLGADLIITGSQGTGTGAGGSIIFQVAPAGGTGTAQNSLVDALNIESTGRTRMLTGATTGLYVNDGGAGLIGFYHSGTRRSFIFGNALGGLELSSTNGQPMVFTGTTDGFRFNNGSGNVFLQTDDANKLALRNGTNAQTFNVYSTYTDASNYERLTVNFSGGQYNISSNALGTGSARPLGISVGASLGISPSGTTPFTWTVTSSGHFLTNSDNTYDIGASGAKRPRNVYVGSTFYSGGAIALNNGNMQVVGSAATAYVDADDFVFRNYAGNAAPGVVAFGGKTPSFPALKRSSASLIVRLADDTANAALESASLKTDAPAGGTAATWKLGVRVAATTLLDTTQYIEVDVGGTLYKLAVVTT
jgi:hypothetical protein